jgi:glutamate N-acetyltransferase / amino-acid N-acetyltransferase
MSTRIPPPNLTIELPEGFQAAGLHCGLKSDSARDLGLLLAGEPAPVAAMFTQNALLGAHIPVCKDHLQRSNYMARAILVNSRNANCATGEQGIRDAITCCRELAERIGCAEEHVLMASTGPIGAPLPTQKIVSHLDQLLEQASSSGGMDFAQAIMTTDTHPKAARVTANSAANGPATTKPACITGFTKGSGMIHPNMATMLGFLMTDAAGGKDLAGELRALAARSFHRTTVDGDTSPNDSLFLWANGKRATNTRDCEPQLLEVASNLARQLAADGEGASRLMTIEVRGARNEDEASQVGRVIATSPLVKTAVAGRDPNWGRILSAAGRSGVPFATDSARVWVGATEVFTRGVPHPDREVIASKHLQEQECIVLGIDLGTGTAAADIWTCDLTADYIHINADYRS